MTVFRLRFLPIVMLVAILAQPAASGALASTPEPASPEASPPPACPVTHPNGARLAGGGIDPNGYENDFLSTTLWLDGRVVFAPGGPGFVLPDGGLGMKWGWVPSIEGELTITGERLDAPAPPLRAMVGEGWVGDQRFFPSYIVFSTPGCWEVTVEVDKHNLNFITLVILEGDGPDWRPESIP